MLAGMGEGVLVAAQDGAITLVNPAFRRQFSITGPVEGKNLIEISRHPDLLAAFKELVATGKSELVREITIQPGKTTLLTHWAPLTVNGVSQGVVAVFHDISATETGRKHAPRFCGQRVPRAEDPDHRGEEGGGWKRSWRVALGRRTRKPGPSGSWRPPPVGQRPLGLDHRRLARPVALWNSRRARLLEGKRQELEACLARSGAMQLVPEKAKKPRIRGNPPKTCRAEAGITARVNPQLLEQALTNLIENAFKNEAEWKGLEFAAWRVKRLERGWRSRGHRHRHPAQGPAPRVRALLPRGPGPAAASRAARGWAWPSSST